MAVTLSVGTWQLTRSVADVREAGQARDFASAGLATVTLIERLQDERDVAAQVRAAGSDNPKLQDSYVATDRARADFESALQPFPTDAFEGQLEDLRSGIGKLDELRPNAFAEGQPSATTIDGYGELILALIRLTDRAVQRAVALTDPTATATPTAGLSALLLAAEALSQQRTAITTVLARDRATSDERQALQTSSRIARESLGTFTAEASPPILLVYERAGDSETAAEADAFAQKVLDDDGPYTKDGLLPARWANLSSERLNQIRLTAWTAATDLIDRAGSELNRNRLHAAFGIIVGLAVLLLAGVAVFYGRRFLLDRPTVAPVPAAPPGSAWQDPLPCTLSHRTQGLLDEQLTLISELESTETDPERLAALFQLDHLATRMRRIGENLITVTGQPTPRHWPRPLTLLEITQAAVSESRRYDKVKLAELPTVAVDAEAVIDTVHIIAELLDNATAANPDQTVTVFAGEWSDGRVTIEIHDHGPGMPFPRRALINARLSGVLPDDPASTETGLRIVALLAGRHGIEVKLTHPGQTGIAATVTFPTTLLVPVPPVPAGGLALEPPPYEYEAEPTRKAAEPYLSQ